jgi:hypothetical protein
MISSVARINISHHSARHYTMAEIAEYNSENQSKEGRAGEVMKRGCVGI